MTHWKRLAVAFGTLALVLAVGTAGYVALGFEPLDAAYQTVTTVSTVGFREVEPLSARGQLFTIALILLGVGSAFYAFGALIETLIEGRINELIGRRRMDRSIASLSGHVILCGWGRVGRSIAPEMASAGRSIVTIEIDPDATIDASMLAVTGDATSDDVLRAAGVERASALIAAADSDAVNSFITLSARAINPELFIVARVRSDDSGRKLRRAGADRVVNPQSIGGMRMAAFVLRPNVAEFVDVAMHEDRFEFRLEEVTISEASPLAGTTLRDAQVRERTGALVLALRGPDESFQTNPKPETTLRPGHVIIAVGTQDELASLTGFARG